MSRFTLPLVLVSALGLVPATTATVFGDEPPAPAAAPSAEQVLGWVNDLGSDDFRTREQASRSLAAAGEAAREALETAVKSSDSLEVRWRAQQLLLRLDGKGERAVETAPKAGAPRGPGGLGPRAGGPGAAGGLDDAWRELLEGGEMGKLRELIERMFKDVPGRNPLRDFGVAPLAPWGEHGAGRVVAGELTLKRGWMGMGPVTLEVRRRDAAGGETRATYSGTSLESILEAHPDLKDHPDLPELQRVLEESAKREQDLRGSFKPGFSFKSSQGVEIRQDGQGALVRIHEQGPDGQPVVKEYRGESLEQIQREHPELADKIGGLGGIQLRMGPPRVFRGPREEPLPPVTPREPLPVPTPEPTGPRFGVIFAEIEPALAAHLKLAPGRGVLVHEVVPGSQAAALGVKPYDVLETVDGKPVGPDDVSSKLREAARTQAPLALGIVRDGTRMTLSR